MRWFLGKSPPAGGQKSVGRTFTLFVFKILSAVFTGLLIAVIFQALMDYRYFSFMFLFLTVCFAFFTMVRKWGFLAVLLVDLLFILLLVLAKVYIMIADKA